MRKFIVLLCLTVVFCACRHKEEKSSDIFFKGKDSYQREVVLNSEPLRVVSFSQAVTEGIYLLHAEDKLVGISTFCDYPPETKNIAKVGDLLNINVESVLAQHPDLIIVGSIVSKATVEKFEKAHVPVFCLKEEKRLSDLPELIRTLGKLVNRVPAADSLARSFEQQISAYRQAIPVNEKSVYYVVGYGASGDFTAAGNTFIHDIITLAGGRNIGKDLDTWSVSREFLFQQNPEYIFIREEDKETFCKTEPYSRLDAVKTGHVTAIPSGWIDNLCPRNFQAIELINKTINN